MIMSSLGLSLKDAQFRNKWRMRINRLTQVHLEKWPLKWSVHMCALQYKSEFMVSRVLWWMVYCQSRVEKSGLSTHPKRQNFQRGN